MIRGILLAFLGGVPELELRRRTDAVVRLTAACADANQRLREATAEIHRLKVARIRSSKSQTSGDRWCSCGQKFTAHRPFIAHLFHCDGGTRGC